MGLIAYKIYTRVRATIKVTLHGLVLYRIFIELKMNIPYFSYFMGRICRPSIQMIVHTINNTNMVILTKQEVTINTLWAMQTHVH